MPTSHDARPLVAVYRDSLLSPSETYIRAQGEALQRYRSHYVGAERDTPSLELPADRVLVVRRDGGRVDKLRTYVFRRLGASRALTRSLRALRPVVLHAHTGIDGAVVLPLARRLGVPLVTTFHGFDATATDETLRQTSLRCHTYLRRREELKRGADVIIAVSQFIRDRLLAGGYPADKVRVHYIGVDTERFRPPAAGAREPVVFFVGRLIAKKGAAHLIAAMRHVQAQRPDVELVIGGEGPRRAKLQAKAAELGVRCRFLGKLTPEEVRDWMGRARVVAVPSITAPNGDSEGLPVVLLEAMAMGTPVVASATAGIPEAVEDGVTGLLARERDEAALAHHVLSLLADENRWGRVSAAAVARIRADFDLARQTAELETIYDQARGLAGGSTRAAS
jgi:glycosyltransferase involved in cell wall biosynthesis